MGFLRPYRAQLWGSLAFAWAAMGMTVLIPWLIGQAVDAIKEGNKPDLLPLALAIFGAAVLRLGLIVVRRVVAGKVSLGVEFDLRQTFYGHLQRLELGFFDGQQTGQLMSRATVDLQSIRFFLGYGLIFITQNLLTIVLASAVMFAMNPWLALVALAPAPLVVYVASRYNRVSRPALQEVQQRIAELTAEAEENVSGIRIVKAFAREEYQLRRFQRAVGRVFDQSIYSTQLQAFFSPLIGFLPQMGIALVLLVGGREVIAGNLSPGDFTTYYFYLVMLAGPMRSLGMTMGMAQRAIASGNRLFEILDREPSIQSPPGAPALPVGGGRVELRGVTLHYEGGRRAENTPIGREIVPSAEVPALSGVDLEVEAGKTVALVGPSGAGKTSLVALIARLYDPDEGAVLVDGADVRGVEVASLRKEIAFVADDSFLFTASVAENIAYAQPEATMEAIEAAARRAQADGFIRALPDGYETRVGERGLTLSGGQRQRVAIARALLADPRILILDDATSSVDATTEAAIKAGLQEAMAGRTTFIIAHRLSTVSLADEIVVIDGGRIVDRGTHEELMEGCGFYREIAEHGLADSVFLQRDLEEREEMAKL
ncbi:MAG: ATP-binding cassette, subfamily bacterial [Solirubrobacterales bacterium]|jgi:ATP-binding cassette subfamily B protein|nr:ATP-binding cassette, subfamily bacterial [Solirubrobacterales bacterium]